MAIGKSFAPIFADLQVIDEEVKPSAFVNINSASGLINTPPMLATYAASKAALHSLTQAQRRDMSKTTLVIGVYPGPIDTDMEAMIPIASFRPVWWRMPWSKAWPTALRMSCPILSRKRLWTD